MEEETRDFKKKTLQFKKWNHNFVSKQAHIIIFYNSL